MQLSFDSLRKCNSQGIFVTRVQPEGPASKILQPGDKIIQVFIRKLPRKVRFCLNAQLKTTFSVPGERIQLCEHRSRQRSRPPEDVSEHCGYDCHSRPASVVVSGDLQRGVGGVGSARARLDRRTEKILSWLSYFSTRRRLDLSIAVGTIYSRDLRSLHPAGGDRPLRVVDQSATAASTSPQKANTVVYIFLYKRKLKIWPVLKQMITVVPVHHLFFPLFRIFFVVLFYFCVLFFQFAFF